MEPNEQLTVILPAISDLVDEVEPSSALPPSAAGPSEPHQRARTSPIHPTNTTTQGATMHITKNDIPVRLQAPGAIARQLPDFGIADGAIGAEYFSLGAGTDLAPLLAGLDDDACASPHWGYIIQGEVVVTYTDGNTEQCRTGDVFHWPAGHSVLVNDDAEIILFSPQDSHGAAMDHIAKKLAG